ncbi:MAG: hypothetical protein K6L76_07715 [Agarilytica sp.]
MHLRTKSLFLFVCCSVFAMSPVIQAQKIKNNSVKYQYVLMPEVALDELDASHVRAELVFKTMQVKDKRIAISTSDSVCNALNKKVGKEGPYKNHYYKISYNDPKPLLVVKDAKDQVIYAKRVPTAASLVERFGRGCMSSKESLDKTLVEHKQVHKAQHFINK